MAFMGTFGQLRDVEKELINDMIGTTLPFSQLARKYGVSRQAIFNFCHRKGIKRPKREHLENHTENCSICQSIIRISKRPQSDFISSRTIKEELAIEPRVWKYHIRILRRDGLVPEKFGRLHSKKVELAYQIYFKKILPVSTIEKQVGLKNLHARIRDHKASGWEIPDPLFTYDGDARKARRKIKTREENK